MTLVELLVAIGVTTIIMALSTMIFMGQFKSYRSGLAVKSVESDAQKAMEVLRDDIALAGWAVKPQMAFYFSDSTTAADQIYVSDITVINPQNTTQMLRLVDSGPNRCGGCRLYKSNAPLGGSLDINGDGSNDLVVGKPVLVCHDDGSDTNATRIRTIGTGGALNTSVGADHVWVTPAIQYSVADNSTTRVLKRLDRDTSGAQPMAENVVDLQVVYGDLGSAGCTSTTCPPSTSNLTPTVGYGAGSYGQMSPFDASKVKWVNLYVVTRSAERVKSQTVRPCRPAVGNRPGDNSSNACGYEYRVYVTGITPLANKK